MADKATRQNLPDGAKVDHSATAAAWRDPGWLLAGMRWGATATVAMTALMLVGAASGVSPMPKPIPVALVGHTLEALPGPAAIGLGLLAHLGYGTAAGVALAAWTRRVGVLRGLGFGVLLWLVMGLVFLPYLGWGLFGTSKAPAIAGATLVLHLVYGGTLGALLARAHLKGTTAA